MKPATTAERQLITAVWEHYKSQGRHDLPWRHTTDPYRIVVSEVMLQQTQVTRVLPKYREFLRRFPSTKRLAEASLADVLGVWQGLGYNRRAKMLHQAAAVVREQYRGRWPQTEAELCRLPGVGVYTARAVLAFVYNQPTLLLETNIKTVLLVHCFPGEYEVTEAELYHTLSRVEDKACPREWYWALMDYGAWLKQTYPRVHRRVRGYRAQSPFRGSDREIRGAIIRWLHHGDTVTTAPLQQKLPFHHTRVKEQLAALQAEGLVIVNKQTKRWQLPE